MDRVTERIYLDYAAAAPLIPAARLAMGAVLETTLGNPSAIHAEGQATRALIETARQSVARALVTRPEQIVFLSGGTEANNLAVQSAIMAARVGGRELSTMKVLTTAIEHPSLLEPLRALASDGLQVEYVPVSETGEMILSELRARLTPEVVLVACAYINSEVGTIQPVRTISSVVHEYAASVGTAIWVHIDGAQASYWVSCQWDSLRADTLALDAGKCGGPLGSGVLVRSLQRTLSPLQRGGGQEQGARAGTEAVISIVGAGAAIAAAQTGWKERSQSVAVVRDAAWQYCQEVLPEAIYTGATGVARVANNLHISVPGIDTEYAVVVLDARGVAASTKSACAGAGGGESAVVRVLTNDAARARSTLRFTLGPETTAAEMRYAIDVLAKHCAQMRTLT